MSFVLSKYLNIDYLLKDKYSHEELSELRHEFRSIIRPSLCDGKMVSETQATILDGIAEEYQVR